MNGESTYFIFNKDVDYLKCRKEHISISDGNLSIEDGCTNGFLFSSVLDSGVSNTVWGRVKLDAEYGKDSYFSMGFYCVESIMDKEICEEIIQSDNYSLTDKLHMLKHYLVMEVSNATDVLLRNAIGRYLFFKVDFFGQAGDWPSISSIKISFPYSSIIKYLPEIYQSSDNGFLKGFMGMFSSMFFDLEENINKASTYLESDVASHSVLLWLAEMVSIWEADIWKEAQLRRLVKNAVTLYRKKGTAEGLTELIQTITLKKAYIVESYTLRKHQYNSAANLLYGNNPYRITVLIEEQATSSQRELMALDRLIGFFVPIGIEYVLVRMKNMILLDHYTYLGINSYINGYNDMAIDESVQLSLVKVAAY